MVSTSKVLNGRMEKLEDQLRQISLNLQVMSVWGLSAVGMRLRRDGERKTAALRSKIQNHFLEEMEEMNNFGEEHLL